MIPQTDLLLGDRYRLTDRIAGGGMGEIWRAQDTVLGRTVAIKILRREYADDAVFLERFRAEARHSAGLSHPHIAAVHDFGEGGEGRDGGNGTGEPSGGSAGASGAGGSPYLVMEHVPGEPLSALVSREGTLTPARTLEVIGQAALGLQAAHDAGVIHRDVKPGNLLVTPDGVVKITDFGIARATNSVPLTQTGAIMGTAYYISPEQASGQSVTPASDIYSLGVVGYECLTGRRPFPGDTPVSVALAQVSQQPPDLPDDIPGPVRDLVMRMLAKSPHDRPPSAGALGREALAMAPIIAAAAAAAAAGQSTAEGSTAMDRTQVLAGPHQVGVSTGRLSSDTNPGFRLPDETRRPSWVAYAVGLALVALLVLALVRACATSSDSPRGAASTGPAGTVTVRAADFRGRRVQVARAALVQLGLRVRVQRTPGGSGVATVKDVSPTGPLASGTLVTLTAVAPTQDGTTASSGSTGTNEPTKNKGKTKGSGKGQ